MIDFELEHQITDFNSLKDLWSKFREYYRMGQARQPHSAEEESEFLECKKQIAQLHEKFMDALPPANDKTGRRMQAQGRAILDHVIRCVTIKHIATFYDNDHKTFETDWNNAYLLLNDTIANITERRDILARMSYTRVAMESFIYTSIDKVKKTAKSPSFQTLVAVVVLLGTPVVLHVTGIYTIERLYRDVPQSRPLIQQLDPIFNLTSQFNLPFTKIQSMPRYINGRQGGRPEDRPLGIRLPEERERMNMNEMFGAIELWFPPETFEPRGAMGMVIATSYENYDCDQGPVELFIFLTSTIAEAETFKARYQQWYSGDQNINPTTYDQQYTVHVARNVIVFISAPTQEIRNYFRNVEFNIK